MKVDLAVAGRGAVTPAGVGLKALAVGEAHPVMTEQLRPGRSWPVLRVDLHDAAFARWQREPRLRRASPVTFFLVEAAEQALAGATAEERSDTGLIVAYSAGCLAYSRRFFEGIVQQGQRSASPALFPETVFNSPVSHVVSVLGLNGAAYALVGDECAWVSALVTAFVWLRQGRVGQVLVLGAEEFDPLMLDALQSVRWLRRNCSRGFLTSEGAAGVLVQKADNDSDAVITAARDGWIYRTRAQARANASDLLAQADAHVPMLRTAAHNWMAPLEEEAITNRIDAPPMRYLGDAFTASAAWNTVLALSMLSSGIPRLCQPVWGLNHQFGSLELAWRK